MIGETAAVSCALMRRTAAVFCSLAPLLFLFARSPQDRTVTDPATIVSPRNAAAGPIAIDDLFFSRSVNGGAWSPDGKEIAFSTNLTGRTNLWKVPSNGGWPVQLVASDDRQLAASWSPDGKWIVYQQDHGGNEAWDLYAVPSHGGEPVNLTNTTNVSESGALFSPDSRQLAFAMKPTAAPATDVAVLDVAPKTVRNLTNEKAADRSWSAFAWSRDGKTIYATRADPTRNERDLPDRCRERPRRQPDAEQQSADFRERIVARRQDAARDVK